MIQGPRAMPAAFFCGVSSIFDSHKTAKNTNKGIHHFFIKEKALVCFAPLCDEFMVAAVRPLWKERTGLS